ncbi:MAG TPA: hypothetical protein VNF47_00720 [Streptosporangiaceae bacterium]|nr:hypothetical protein [Streptosporangiaceae bacterium]
MRETAAESAAGVGVGVGLYYLANTASAGEAGWGEPDAELADWAACLPRLSILAAVRRPARLG